MVKKVIAYLLILAVVVILRFFPPLSIPQPSYNDDLDIPSPAMGQVIANAIHRAVTDPYFKPLENLAGYLRDNPGVREISLSQLTSWSPDEAFPTCFVWDIRTGNVKVDQPSNAWGIERVVEHIEEALQVQNPQGHMYINTFEADDQLFWLGFFIIPKGEGLANQCAGCFFSIDNYLDEDVPRFIDGIVNAPRFPLASFQRTNAPIHGERDGDISIRILNNEGEVYLQRGRSFDPLHMIYAESKYYLNPIVCLQEGWDLQIFSTKVPETPDFGKQKKIFDGFLIAALLALSLLFWWGTK